MFERIKQLLPTIEEIVTLTETCQLCGQTIITGHAKRVTRTNSIGNEVKSLEVVNQKLEPGSCPESKDGSGRHVITGM